MQAIVDMLQIAVIGVVITLGLMLLITILRLRKVKTTSKKLIVQIEEGTDL